MTKYSLIFSVLILFISCDWEDTFNNNIRIDPELISELNSKSYDTLIIESKKFVLEAYLWRDFMPVSPPNGKPMISINWLINIDSTKMPDNIDLVEQYVIYNDSIWIAKYVDESTTTQPEYKISKISKEGPKWGPKIFVDVISKVHDSNTDNDYYIRIKDVYVLRTD